MKFHRLAWAYDLLEWLIAGQRLQRARTNGLEALAGRRSVLSVGEGHGRFAEAFVHRFPNAQLTGVEASAAMLARAKRRLANGPGSPVWIQADVQTWRPVKVYDAIVTCFFLDCFTPDELGRIVGKIAACAAPDAVWLIVDFAVPPRGFARWRAKVIHTLMYGFFRFVTELPARRLTPPDGWLRAAGFARREVYTLEWGLLKTEVWQRVSHPTPHRTENSLASNG